MGEKNNDKLHYIGLALIGTWYIKSNSISFGFYIKTSQYYFITKKRKSLRKWERRFKDNASWAFLYIRLRYLPWRRHYYLPFFYMRKTEL